MSRLDELIEKLCPDGAEFLTLQECTQKVKNIKWKSYSGNDKKYIDLSSVDRDLHCIMETQNINSVIQFSSFVPCKISLAGGHKWTRTTDLTLIRRAL